ncbi:hypothetical protein [Euzebya sp.]|uniref:hypothetical protein n=1 Tax=Euzebya sp. TaxID=1971409 RepID=UPI0035157390
MTRRVASATAGGVLAAAALTAVLVWSPWRPTGFLVGLALIALAVPAVTAAGTWAGLRAVAGADAPGAARLAALGAPVTTVTALFCIQLAARQIPEGAQQAWAVVVGVAVAAALAARFTGPEAEVDAASPPER